MDKEKVCKLIKEMIADEDKATTEYLALIDLMPEHGLQAKGLEQLARSIIVGIQEDESKHLDMLTELHGVLCGNTLYQCPKCRPCPRRP